MTEHAEQAQERRLFVSWRDPAGSIHPVGCLVRRLDPDGQSYRFAYLKATESLQGFEPLPGLPELHLRYESSRLFPVFANRVMPRSRPDFDLLASRLHLGGDADPFEVLARTGGRRVTDRIEVFAPPERTADDESTVLFLVRGIRHLAGAADAVSALAVGDHLVMVDDRDNRFNAHAILVRVSDGHHVGWLPDYLVDHVHELRQLNCTDPQVLVEHVNDTTVAAHMRLLCRLTAPWPAGYVPFAGAAFQPLASLVS